MRQEVRDHLIRQYNNLDFKQPFTAIKYHFKYNNVDVNIFFDAYDNRTPSLCMILSYNKKFYYTSLNVNKTTVRTEFLVKIPPVILNQILNMHNHLDDFFEDIERHILGDNNKSVINYEKDVCFINTMKYSRSRTDLPFLFSLRKAKMTNNMFKRLSETMGIEKEILEKIQSAGFTIVRTDDVGKRKSLTAIIDNSAIFI